MVQNYNISFQVLAIVAVLMLQLMFRLSRKILLVREKVFFVILNIATLVAILDLTHILGINLCYEEYPKLALLIGRIYLISIVIFAASILLYALCEAYQGSMFYDKRRIAYVVPAAIAFPTIFNMDLKIHLGEDAVYVYGNAMYFACIIGILYMFMSLAIVRSKRKEIELKRRVSVYLSCAFLLTTVILQLIFTNYLLVSVGISVCLVYMYFCLEPPGDYIDGILGVFNYEAYLLYIKNRCSNDAPVSLLSIRIPNYSTMQEGIGTAMRAQFLKELCAYLTSFKTAKTFYVGNGELMMAFEKPDYFINNIQQIRERMDKVFNVALDKGDVVEIEVNSIIIAYPAERMVDNMTFENVIGTLDYFSSKYRLSDQNVYLCIDRKQLREKAKYDHVAASLREAIDENRIEVYYQCIYSLESDCTVALEALMRIKDADGELMNNDMIIDYAEKTGLIREIGNIVLKKVCSFVRTHSLYELDIYTIHINLSVLQAQDSHLAADFIDILESYQLPASMFRFEMSGILTTYTSVNLKKNMDRLSQMGARFIIGDYGFGHVNIEKIVQMNLSSVKLGMSAVRAYFSDAKARNELRLNCRLMRQMNMTLMAAGVENQQQFTELKKLGVEFMQGYAFYRPMDGPTTLMAITRERDKGLEREALYERVL